MRFLYCGLRSFTVGRFGSHGSGCFNLLEMRARRSFRTRWASPAAKRQSLVWQTSGLDQRELGQADDFATLEG